MRDAHLLCGDDKTNPHVLQESIVEISYLINSCILEYLHFNIVILVHIKKFLNIFI